MAKLVISSTIQDMDQSNQKWSWASRGRSFRYAWAGVKTLVRTQHNAWIHLSAMVAVIIAGVLFGITPAEWALVVMCIGAVLAAEAVNSAVEALADRITRQHDVQIGVAKDLAAGAVLLTAAAAAVVGLIIFIPYIIRLCFTVS